MLKDRKIHLRVILLDFDGTVQKHTRPLSQSEPLPNFIKTVNKIVNAGHKIILYTMRSGEYLDQAVKWFKTNNIPLYAVNEHPTQHNWTMSPKCHGNICIDDRNLFTPKDSYGSVDWFKVEEELEKVGVIPTDEMLNTVRKGCEENG